MTNRTKILIAAGVIIITVLLVWFVARSQKTAYLYQSEMIAQNIGFPAPTQDGSPNHLRYFTGSAFAELDLATLTSKALTKEFDLPEVETVIWDQTFAVIKLVSKPDGDLAAIPSNSGWWRIDFNNNSISAAATANEPSKEMGKLVLTNNTSELEIIQTDKAKTANLRDKADNKRFSYTIIGENQAGDFNNGLLLTGSPGNIKVVVVNSNRELYILSHNELPTQEPVPIVKFDTQIVPLESGYMEYDFIKNSLTINLFPSTNPDQDRLNVMKFIESQDIDPHQIRKQWEIEEPERY